MLLTTKKSVTTVEEIPFEVPTPFFSKRNRHGNPEYFAIEESKEGASIVHLFLGGDYRSMQVLGPTHSQFATTANEVVQAEQITEVEFLKALTQLIPASKELIDL